MLLELEALLPRKELIVFCAIIFTAHAHNLGSHNQPLPSHPNLEGRSWLHRTTYNFWHKFALVPKSGLLVAKRSLSPGLAKKQQFFAPALSMQNDRSITVCFFCTGMLLMRRNLTSVEEENRERRKRKKGRIVYIKMAVSTSELWIVEGVERYDNQMNKGIYEWRRKQDNR